MNKSFFKRSACLLLALVLMLCTAPVAAGAVTLIQLKDTDVTLEEIKYPYTGEEIRPNVTVRVDGKLLTLDRDYWLKYADNLEIGTGKVIVTGIADAGYTGTVEVSFAITQPQPTEPETTEPETTEPETTEPETTEPETTEPETTEPETTEPETTEPEETKPGMVKYAITRGNKSTWYAGSAKALSFTTDGAKADIAGIKIDGKDLPEKHYELSGKDNAVVTLKSSFLKLLSVDKHTITVLFDDGQADGTFRVAKGLDASNPETGDNFSLGLWAAVMGLSAASAAVLFLLRRKVF